jgi:hypothetical protein
MIKAHVLVLQLYIAIMQYVIVSLGYAQKKNLYLLIVQVTITAAILYSTKGKRNGLNEFLVGSNRLDEYRRSVGSFLRNIYVDD